MDSNNVLVNSRIKIELKYYSHCKVLFFVASLIFLCFAVGSGYDYIRGELPNESVFIVSYFFTCITGFACNHFRREYNKSLDEYYLFCLES